jgi:sugar-specific transcriptional regulator TrmB
LLPVEYGSEITGEETVRGILRSLGLTDKEAEVYIFLSKHGVLKCREISRGMKRHTAQVYRILKILQSKSLLESTLEAPTRFSAVPFETVLDLSIKAKRDEAARMETTRQEILNYWKSIRQQGLAPPLGNFVVIEGNQKIYLKIAQMIKETKNRLSMVATVSGLARADQFGLFDAIFTHPLRSSIQFRFLTDLSSKNVNTMKTVLKRTPETGFNLKGRNSELGLPSPRMVIRDEEEILFFITPKPEAPATEQDVCLWTDCKELVRAFSTVFEDLWRNSTDIEKTMAEIESGSVLQKILVGNTEAAKKTYDEIIGSAKEQILILTSSNGLVSLWKNSVLKEEWKKRGISVKIMAPITTANLKAALQLSDYCPVRHVPSGYIETTVVDKKHVFQFDSSLRDREIPDTPQHFENTVYNNDHEYAKRITLMLNSIWKGAATPSNVTLDSASIPLPTFGTPDALTSFAEAWKNLPAKNLPKSRSTGGMVLIHPPSHLGLPIISIGAAHYEKESTFGEGNSLYVHLRLKTPKGYNFVPTALVETNEKALIPQVTAVSGTPEAKNFQLVKPYELQIRKQGNMLFAGWTVRIPLPPTNHCLPPSCMLLEAYGHTTHNKCSSTYASAGVVLTSEYDRNDAFVTFLDPSWKYAGPGTHGAILTNIIMTTSRP